MADSMENAFPMVSVPNVIGFGRVDAERILAAVPLRYIAKLVSSATGTGVASAQTPVAGTMVREFSVVKVEYPNPLLDAEEPVDGPQPQSGLLDGVVTNIIVSKDGASIGLSVLGLYPFFYFLYKDSDPVTREVYMRRGAMLAIAQRAFSGRDNTRIRFEGGMIDLVEIFR